MQMSKVPIISGYDDDDTMRKTSKASWTKWKSEATNPFLALRVYVKMSEIHETGGVWHKI
jgi:hypothetical protein